MIELPPIQTSSQICEECVVSKQHRDHFPKRKSQRAKKVLELVHPDICGPINPTSNGGKCYYIMFIDDYSRKTLVYFLQEKFEVFSVFKSFKTLLEKERGKPFKLFCFDRGEEYSSQEFVNFCENHGIQQQLIVVYSPQQNGVSERKNRTILNMVQTIMSKGHPKKFLA